MKSDVAARPSTNDLRARVEKLENAETASRLANQNYRAPPSDVRAPLPIEDKAEQLESKAMASAQGAKNPN